MAQNGKVALITGANKGIGLETARQLGQQGYTVLVGARDEAKGAEAIKALKDDGVNAQFLALSPTDEASLKAAAATVEAKYGRLDVLVNNAGYGSFGTLASEEALAEWHTTFAINVFGLVATTQAFLPLIKKSEAGRIVHLTSILGSLTLTAAPDSPFAGYVGRCAAYGASKAAVNMYTVHLAHELATTKIKVNAVHPGSVVTDMNPGGSITVVEGARSSVEMATLGEEGPTGTFTHLGETLPW